MPTHSPLPITINGAEATIESGGQISSVGKGTLHTDAELDAASVPQECFIRSVLTQITMPNFKFIAPGLEFPQDKEAFARQQNFTRLPYEEGNILAVLLFVVSDKTVDFNCELRSVFTRDNHCPVNDGTPIFAGLYFEAVTRSWDDMEEAGFCLLLLFPVQPNPRHQDYGARMNDGTLITTGSFTEQFQHGRIHPLGGRWRSLRMERLFDLWTELKEDGVLTAGKDGVKGGIESFKDADNGSWEYYCIAPSWQKGYLELKISQI